MRLNYTLIVSDDETGEQIITLQSYSQEGLEEEMGKSKIKKAIEQYQLEQTNEYNQYYESEENKATGN